MSNLKTLIGNILSLFQQWMKLIKKYQITTFMKRKTILLFLTGTKIFSTWCKRIRDLASEMTSDYNG